MEIIINTKVENIDIDSLELLLGDGSKVRYDKLLITTGSRNTIPPIDGIDNVYTLRGLNDALNIKDSLKESKQVIVIGGGILGLEMSWILHQHGIKVTIIEFQSRLMPRQLDYRASEILKNTVQACGIEVLTSTGAKGITGNQKVEGVLIGDKVELKCDIVIHSTGIKPNKELTVNTKVETKRGIVVNNKMETSVDKKRATIKDIHSYTLHAKI